LNFKTKGIDKVKDSMKASPYYATKNILLKRLKVTIVVVEKEGY
jgi:hypothetical protein